MVIGDMAFYVTNLFLVCRRIIKPLSVMKLLVKILKRLVSIPDRHMLLIFQPAASSA